MYARALAVSSPGRTYIVDYELSVPERTVIEVENTNGEVEVVSLTDWISIRGTNGNITLHGIEASASARTVNGRVSAEVVLPKHGMVDLSATNGNVLLEVPTTVSRTSPPPWPTARSRSTGWWCMNR